MTEPAPPSFVVGELGARLRPWLVLGLFAVSTLILARIFGGHYPLEKWLFWRYLRAWGWVFVFSLSALSVGGSIVTALSAPGERLDGQVTLSFATGVYAFFLAMFAVGVAGWLGPTTFFVLPLALFALGARRLSRELLAFCTKFRDARNALRFSLWESLGFGLGFVGLSAIFVTTLVPENVAYDAAWYHLPLAEHYAAAGAIRRFAEGEVPGTIPHLASILYTWAFLAPGELFDHIELAAQLEFVIFLFTLGGIPLLVRCLVPGTRARASWVWLFLFPSIFVYDSSLLVAADHVAALWAVPAFVTLLRALRELRPRACVLLVIQLSGLVMTKYTASMGVVFPVLAIGVRMLQLALFRPGSRFRLSSVLGPLCAFGAGLALTAPHWLKNWLWYGDPIYPMLHRHLHLRPWIPDGELLYALFSADNFAARGAWSHRLRGALHGLHDYSYKLYTFEGFHGRFPFFGSLFTFCLVALPFLKGARRVWLLVLSTHVAIFVWYLFFSEDRYLQAVLPWMVAGTSAIFTLAWRAGWPARVGVVTLAALQLVWGAELVFWPTHQMHGKSGLAVANDFFAQTMRKEFDSRVHPFEDRAQIGRAIAKSSKVLIHSDHGRLGIGVQTATDAYRIQYGISYGYLESSTAVYRLLHGMGITHVLWVPDKTYGDQTVASELMFHGFVTRHLVNQQRFGGRVLAELPKKEPADDGHTVLYFACGGPYANGLYELADLRLPPILPPGYKPSAAPAPRVAIRGDNAEELARQASYAVLNRSCAQAPQLEEFERVGQLGPSELLLRKKSK
jgi:hypothetical protein